MAQVEWRTPDCPQYQKKVIERRRYRYNMSRPWEEGFYQANAPGVRRKFVFVQPIVWSIFRGDRVEILVGKDKGKQGIVNYVVKERNWVTVEGLNCTYRLLKANKQKQMIKSECPLLVTNQVSLVDPTDNKPTKIEWRFTEEGKRVRVSVRTGRIIPIPLTAEETYDYKTKSTYVEQPKDTPAKALERITFVPKLMTFEQDIMEEMKITEEGEPAKTYWY